ncbi:MAG: NADH-quinone oxidoreductase subunit L [Flavobacteriales bacterium]|nr:NADH-quinone oxidoreductase subunit L [Flavobacteriales bacterium]
MENWSYIIWILIIPFLSFLFAALPGTKLKSSVSGLVGIASILSVAILSYITAYSYFFVSGKIDGVFQKIIAFNYVWVRFSEVLQIDIGGLLDPISVMMLVVISTISLMVHIYSWSYMHGETGFARYYAFLSLFTFSMLGLVLATNLFQMYIFWELVGVSSFLLIGFYYEKPSAIAASKKAFIVTRFADFGFLLGILLLAYYTNTFDFITLTDTNGTLITNPVAATFMGASVLTWAMGLIFIGGAGKSAMFPLHIWLPDAMEGPTPVSALIHAATMVVAGVYLVARMFPVYLMVAPDALEIVAYTGGFTALFAAVIACTQHDIKRILAFSTMSQIGYMMLALGVSGYGGEKGLGYMASMFHLFTHAMFKALLFLGAGSVIHAVHSNLIGDMGNLKKYMPITHITFLIACLAIAGIPPFAGFFSKDEILVAAFEHNKLLFSIAFFVAGLTAFYMFRLYFRVFWGKKQAYHHAPHESPFIMILPLILLAVASCLTGFIPFGKFVSSDGRELLVHTHWNIALPAIGFALTGIFTAMAFYKKETNASTDITNALGAVYKWAYKKFYLDEVYLFVTKNIIFNGISKSIAWFDKNIIDASMDGMALVTNYFSDKIKGAQSGSVQQYTWWYMAGSIGIVIFVLYFLMIK